MSRRVACVLFCFASLCLLQLALGSAVKASAYVDAESREIHIVHSEEAVSSDFDKTKYTYKCAVGEYKDEINENGWSFLLVSTSNPTQTETCTDTLKAYSAGYVEAVLTWERIYQTIINNNALEPFPAAIDAFLSDNYKYVRGMVDQNAATDSYWYHVGLVLEQMEGMIAGYQYSCEKYDSSKCVNRNVLMSLTQGSDLETLSDALKKKELADNGGARMDDIEFFNPGKCSALIKLTKDDLFASHVTWSGLTSMLRIYKMYYFDFLESATGTDTVGAQAISFSSYPGSMYSGDDFYMMSSNLMTMETTIGNSNATLFQEYITPNSVLEWTRNMVANRLAKTGREWTTLFSKYNSGTYNNEWMVVDYNQVTGGGMSGYDMSLKAEAVLVLDQVPGFIRTNDLSESINKQKYFASYNLPYDQFIFNISGCQEMVNQHGSWFSYEMTPRAQIFRRDQGAITDIEGMKKIMRYNDYTHDPLSRCDCKPFPYSAENAISCRDDLNPANGTYPISALGHRAHVGSDAKITSWGLMTRGKSWIISGPTYDQLPVFEWSKSSYSHLPHEGMPDRYEFPWVLADWNNVFPPSDFFDE